MKAKEYLQQLHKLDTVINQRMSERDDLRLSLTSISSPDFSKERVQGGELPGDAGFTKTIAKIIDIEAEINALIDEYVDKKNFIISQIHGLNNVDEIEVLFKRYVDRETFEKIAVDLNFSIRNIYFIHGRALQSFQNKYLITEES